MKKFRYRLQKILSLKQTLKKQAQKELARAENEHQRSLNILNALKDELALRLKLEKSSRRKKLNVRQLSETQRYFAQLAFLIQHQTNTLAESKKIAEEKRQTLIEASREERKYERLGEIRKEEYMHTLENALQKENDEFARNIVQRQQKP